MHRHSRAGTLAALAVSVAVAACGSGANPPTPGTSGSPLPPAPTTLPNASPAATPTPTPPAAGRWEAAGRLALARASTHAVALADGRVLVVGNDNICTPGGAWDDSPKADLYDPAKGTWVPTAPLNAPRTDFVAVPLPDGRALITGGLTSSDPEDGVFGSYSSSKVYDPATGRWADTALLATARMAPIAAVLPSGQVLVAGGRYVDADRNPALATAEVFDPESATWSRTASMAGPRTGAQAVTLADGRVLVMGGDGADSDVGGPPEVYDPAKGTWTVVSGATLALPHRGFSLVPLAQGGALVVGGEGPDGPTAAVARFDANDMTWLDAAPMPVAVERPATTLLGDGRVLVAGGMGAAVPYGTEGMFNQPGTTGAFIYDPATNTWTPTAPLPAPRERGTFVTLRDGSVLLVGGDAGLVGEPSAPWCPEPTADVLRYVPANLASFPQARPTPDATLAKSTVKRSAAKPADATKASASIAAFGVDLYGRLLRDPVLGLAKRNVVFSPTSIAMALAMARAGAKGRTAQQMDTVLHTAGWDVLGPGLNALDRALSARETSWKDEGGASHDLRLRIANAAFGQGGWPIVQGYLDAIARTLGAGLRLVDYRADPETARRTINGWVKQKTSGRIPELLPKDPPVVDETTRLVLVNAIYLKANWETEFDPSDTAPLPFRRLDGSTVRVPTMLLPSGGQAVPLASGPGWRATELRFLGKAGPDGSRDPGTPMAMTLIRPDDLASFERALTPKVLAAVVAKLDAQRQRLDRVTSSGEDGDCGTYAYSLRLFLPSFGVDTRALLKPVLGALGMPDAFDPQRADFTGIHVPEAGEAPVHVGEVVHQANIDVNEKGAEAAAATAVVMTVGGCTGPEPAKTVTLRLDRPFLFLVRDVETGAILFMGRVVDPSAK